MSVRKIQVTNEKVLKGLTKKTTLLARMKELTAEGEKIQKEGDELLQKLAREDEKLRPETMREIAKIEVGEFEEVARVYLGEKGEEEGKIIFEVTDRLEEFKDIFKDKKEKQDEKNNSSDTKQEGTDSGDNAEVVA